VTEVSLIKHERTQKSVHTIPSNDTKMPKRFKRKHRSPLYYDKYLIGRSCQLFNNAIRSEKTLQLYKQCLFYFCKYVKMTTEEIATKYNTNENVKDHQNSILEVLAQRIPQTIDPLSTWIHIPWLSKLRCTEAVIKLFCLNGKLLDQCNIQYPEEISDNCYLHAIVY
jgi:hypothetical protein